MKGKFIAKAWVEITDAEKRKEIHDKIYLLFKQSEDDTLFGYEECELKKCLSINNGVVRLNMWATLKLNNISYINCNFYANGDEDLAVKLFLSIAEMDLNKPETLYYSVPNNLWGIQGQQVGGFIVKHCDIPKLHLTERHYIDKHNPITRPEELAEAVMRGDVKL